MNEYEVEFFARCPENGVRIKYSLQVRTDIVVPVENILAAVQSLTDGYHEAFAERLREGFGGLQKLTAEHHGVHITTHRSGPAKTGAAWFSVPQQQMAKWLDERRGDLK